MTEDQSQSAHYSRQISDDSAGTTSLIKLLMAPNDEKRTNIFTTSRYSKILAIIAMLVIIAIILSTAAIVTSKNEQGNIIFTNS